jgi:hypothetical protein
MSISAINIDDSLVTDLLLSTDPEKRRKFLDKLAATAGIQAAILEKALLAVKDAFFTTKIAATPAAKEQMIEAVNKATTQAFIQNSNTQHNFQEMQFYISSIDLQLQTLEIAFAKANEEMVQITEEIARIIEVRPEPAAEVVDGPEVPPAAEEQHAGVRQAPVNRVRPVYQPVQNVEPQLQRLEQRMNTLTTEMQQMQAQMLYLRTIMHGIRPAPNNPMQNQPQGLVQRENIVNLLRTWRNQQNQEPVIIHVGRGAERYLNVIAPLIAPQGNVGGANQVGPGANEGPAAPARQAFIIKAS